jgi:hypothetical protein
MFVLAAGGYPADRPNALYTFPIAISEPVAGIKPIVFKLYYSILTSL